MAGRTSIATAAVLASGLLLAQPALAQSQAEVQGYQQRLQQLFQRLDQNNDQRLDRHEVNGQPYLQRHFERLDQQQRGYITPADLRAPAAGTPGGGERARRFLRDADRNGDGVISRQEAEPYPWLQRRFHDADRNGDGALSRDELRRLRGSASGSNSPPLNR
jgi:Ca2+-binding EF-hand superfamily protein